MDKQNKILNYFSLLKDKGQVGSSYLFIGEDFSLVKDVVKLINCVQGLNFCGDCWDCRMIESQSHPDLFIVEPEGITTKIEAVREGIKFLSLKSFKLKRKALVIKDAQSLSPAAANAFLKTLEEPPKNSFLAVCTSKLEGLLPTIISRCRKIFLPFNEKEPEGFAKGIQEVLELKTTFFKDRKEFSAFLWALITALRDDLLRKAGYENNRLLPGAGYEIIFNSCGVQELCGTLKDILRIYEAKNTINMNLALNLIKTRINMNK